MENPATTATTPPAPPSESKSATDPKQQQAPPPPTPPPPSAASSDAPPKKRKLEEVGFHYSPPKIRAAVANLRDRFLQACQATEVQKKDVAPEILKEIKAIMELSKKTCIDLYSIVEPVKLSVKPAATTSKYEPAGKTPSAVPPISLAGNFVQNSGGNILHRPDNSMAAGQRLVSPVEIMKEARPCEITEVTKQPGKVLQGSYVIGGSPIGWNFLMWPGTKAAYYGLTKSEWLARQSAK